MAAPKHHPKKGRRNKRSSSFLCSCFGFSSKVSADHGDGKPFSGRQRIAALPVNDRSAPAEVATSSKEIHVVENDQEKTTSPSADGFLTIKTEEKTWEKSKKSPIAKRGEKEKQNNRGHDTWTNQPQLSHSVSLPLPHQKKEKTAVAAAAVVSGEKKGKSGNELTVDGEIDSMVGAGIIMVTLVVMVIWGKVCAILCTAAWLYFIPLFRANLDRSYGGGESESENHRLDLDSREYKKRVVLQGLLDRNQNP